MKILVTGSEGNIGKVLVPYLENQGHEVFGVDIVQGYRENYQTADITDGADLSRIFLEFQPEVVYHLAAMVSRVTCEKSPGTAIKVNVYGTENIIRLCQLIDAKLIFFSTSEVYGNIGGLLKEERCDLQPNNIYGLSKMIGEQLVAYAASIGLKAIIVRPFMFYDENESFGEHRSAMIRFVESLLKGHHIEVHKGSTRSWLHIEDGVVILERLLAIDTFIIVNVGHPESYHTVQLAKMICDELGIDYREFVEETKLPQQMTLTKFPDLTLQTSLTHYTCKISLLEGVRRVIKTVKSKI
jgi:nucleoside-diphosphate-sugar epimerase